VICAVLCDDLTRQISSPIGQFDSANLLLVTTNAIESHAKDLLKTEGPRDVSEKRDSKKRPLQLHQRNWGNSCRLRPPSGFYGVRTNGRNKNRHEATITRNGKTCALGTFGTKEEAALVYDRQARETIGTNPQSTLSLNYETIAAAEEAATQAQARAKQSSATAAVERGETKRRRQ
jgi:hypothetical protein